MLGLFGEDIADSNLPLKLSKYQVYKIQYHYRHSEDKKHVAENVITTSKTITTIKYIINAI
jgi:hypothetical protein